MDIDHLAIDDNSSNFDDRLDLDLEFYSESNESSEPLKEDDSYYRHLEEY